MAKRRSTDGWGWPVRRIALVSFPAASVALSVLLAVAKLARPGVVAICLLLLSFGFLQRFRAKARQRDRRHRPMKVEVRAELGYGRLWIGCGLVLTVLALFLSPLVVAVAGLLAMPALLYQGLAGSGRSVDAEEKLGLAGRSPAEESNRVQLLSDAVARVMRLRIAQRLVDLANLKVKPDEIGVLQSLILGVLPIAFLAYASLAFAIVVSEELPVGRPAKTSAPLVAPEVHSTLDGGAQESIAPTYADSCPVLPEPLEIGHHLGDLFRHDGAAKAGCGGHALNVSATGAWVSAGKCGEEMRSVAVSAPGYKPVILYGEPARFAWSAALDDELVAAEAAKPEGGDVDLVETLEGTSAFARPSPSIERGRENIRVCSEATGTARPFAHLPPSLAYLWLELVHDREVWIWPENDLSGSFGPIAFSQSDSAIARGDCPGLSCYLEVDGERWLGGETGFVSLAEFEPYLPKSSE